LMLLIYLEFGKLTVPSPFIEPTFFMFKIIT
jgi:hypothetical protein